MSGKLDMNPWFSIWVRPRRTIQAIVDYNPNYRLGILSAIYGFSALLGLAQSFSMGDIFGMISILIFTVILSPIWGWKML